MNTNPQNTYITRCDNDVATIYQWFDRVFKKAADAVDEFLDALLEKPRMSLDDESNESDESEETAQVGQTSHPEETDQIGQISQKDEFKQKTNIDDQTGQTGQTGQTIRRRCTTNAVAENVKSVRTEEDEIVVVKKV